MGVGVVSPIMNIHIQCVGSNSREQVGEGRRSLLQSCPSNLRAVQNEHSAVQCSTVQVAAATPLFGRVLLGMSVCTRESGSSQCPTNCPITMSAWCRKGSVVPVPPCRYGKKKRGSGMMGELGIHAQQCSRGRGGHWHVVGGKREARPE